MSKAKDWVFTLNNYTDAELDDLNESLTTDDVKYAVFGYEVAETGTPHLQGFLSLTKRKRMSAVKSILNERCFVETRRGTKKQAIEYCKKENNFKEFGDVDNVNGNQGFRTDLDKVAEMVKDGATLAEVAEAQPKSWIHYHKGITSLKTVLSEPYTPSGLRGVWFYGVAGAGKSRYVHETFTDLYLKQQNKWWDNYQGEKHVLLDDLDTDKLAHHLKIWADRYPCTGEVKGGTVNLTHDLFIVTSNFTPGELFKDLDYRTVEAIERRFSVHEVRLGFEVDENALVDTGAFTTVIEPPYPTS